jgi:hypothetical protein
MSSCAGFAVIFVPFCGRPVHILTSGTTWTRFRSRSSGRESRACSPMPRKQWLRRLRSAENGKRNEGLSTAGVMIASTPASPAIMTLNGVVVSLGSIAVTASALGGDRPRKGATRNREFELRSCTATCGLSHYGSRRARLCGVLEVTARQLHLLRTLGSSVLVIWAYLRRTVPFLTERSTPDVIIHCQSAPGFSKYKIHISMPGVPFCIDGGILPDLHSSRFPSAPPSLQLELCRSVLHILRWEARYTTMHTHHAPSRCSHTPRLLSKGMQAVGRNGPFPLHQSRSSPRMIMKNPSVPYPSGNLAAERGVPCRVPERLYRSAVSSLFCDRKTQ